MSEIEISQTEKRKKLISNLQLSFSNWCKKEKKFGPDGSITKLAEKQFRECKKELSDFEINNPCQ